MTTNSKIDSYLSKHYDEKQLLDRYRISFETMWLTFLLIFVSGMVKIFYGPWAADNTEMMVLVSLPIAYFMVRSVLKGAYFSVQQKSYAGTLIFLAAIGLLNIGISAVSLMNNGSIIENGMLSENLFQFFLGLPFILIPIAYLIKKKVGKNDAEDDE
ncbi:hypothetical protein MmiHf6_14330 [Methanimicrococcus hongohii]|uniref:Uncharacterized protein n=1 Tax=Methanimicrococcus hongohii TaxID=3028295 RepID=A0AA96V0K2_9EURY|nr:DUF6773 family protein [Methanimicrococcus sp. Hf6]WNY24104.1 hypothetical protein MmiHf6_14330 [Methanimicrococcus sp. Hf6]